MDGDSLWQEVFDAFDASEQTCIREEFGEESLASLLDRPVLEELEEEDEALLRLFGCLGPESAISLSFSGFVASTAAESPNLAGPVQACLSQSLASVDVEALAESFTASLEPGTSLASTRLADEFFDRVLDCISDIISPPAAATPTIPTAPTATPAPVTVSRLETVRARGRLLCGGRNDQPGFGFLGADGRNVGFDINLCRAVAAAIFADPDKLEVTTVRAPQRGPIIQSGEVDVLTANTTWTTFRDVYWGNYTITMFYDGQGFMVRKDDGFNSVFDLDGTAICVLSGTTHELNLHSFFGKHGLKLDVLTYEDFVAMSTAYEQGCCDAVTTDKSLFVVMSASTLRNPDDHTILRETISKEPSTPIVPHGDDQWLDIVKVAMSVLINAEELGVTQSNVDDMRNSDDTHIRRMLGTEGEFGQAGLGLSPTFAVDVIRAVGNYGEIYDRYMGPQAQGDAFPLPRALNRLWTDGGLIFAPPLR